MRLELLEGELDVHRLRAGEARPVPDGGGPIHAVLRTGSDATRVCSAGHAMGSERSVAGWRAIRAEGPLTFGQTGILAELARVLAEAGVGLFVLSVHDTDHLPISGDDLERARTALARAEHEEVAWLAGLR